VESLGEKLRSARETKGYTFDQISRDTNIARRYLEALENEDFSQFPGEPYILGFLRNYSEYLGLDSHDLISLYRMLKLQEQPIPVAQLLNDPKPVIPRSLLIAAGAVAALAIAAFVFFAVGRASSSGAAEDVRKNVEYELKSGILEKRLYQGDTALIAVGSDRYKLELVKLGNEATISAPDGDLSLDLGQEAELDLDGNGSKDLKIFVADLFKGDPLKGASLRFELLSQAPAAVETQDPSAASETAAGAAAVAPAPAAATPVPATASGTGSVIFSSGNPYPFTLQATFKGYCLLRWESDRKDREERYFHKAEILNVQAQNGIRLWISNASAVKLQAIGGGKTVDVEIGGAGEVVVSDLKWVKDDDGRFKLTTVRLD